MQFHAATRADREWIYRWRTDPRTTRHFFDPQAIAWETHVAWFDRMLRDPDDDVLIARHGETPVGIMRLTCFTALHTRCGQVGLYMNPDLHGQGFGKQMLTTFTHTWCPHTRPDLALLLGKVALPNIASQRCFLAAGYHAAPNHVWGTRDIREIAALLCASTPPPAAVWRPPVGQPCDHLLFTRGRISRS